MECIKCNTINHGKHQYCSECGTALDATLCNNCSNPIEHGAKICNYCGTYYKNGYSICSSCKEEISNEYKYCPHCRTENKPNSNIIFKNETILEKIFIGYLFLLIGLLFIRVIEVLIEYEILYHYPIILIIFTGVLIYFLFQSITNQKDTRKRTLSKRKERNRNLTSIIFVIEVIIVFGLLLFYNFAMYLMFINMLVFLGYFVIKIMFMYRLSSR